MSKSKAIFYSALVLTCLTVWSYGTSHFINIKKASLDRSIESVRLAISNEEADLRASAYDLGASESFFFLLQGHQFNAIQKYIEGSLAKVLTDGFFIVTKDCELLVSTSTRLYKEHSPCAELQLNGETVPQFYLTQVERVPRLVLFFPFSFEATLIFGHFGIDLTDQWLKENVYIPSNLFHQWKLSLTIARSPKSRQYLPIDAVTSNRDALYIKAENRWLGLTLGDLLFAQRLFNFLKYLLAILTFGTWLLLAASYYERWKSFQKNILLLNEQIKPLYDRVIGGNSPKIASYQFDSSLVIDLYQLSDFLLNLLKHTQEKIEDFQRFKLEQDSKHKADALSLIDQKRQLAEQLRDLAQFSSIKANFLRYEGFFASDLQEISQQHQQLLFTINNKLALAAQQFQLLLNNWDAGIKERGARRFFRFLDECSASSQSFESLLVQQFNQLLQLGDAIEESINELNIKIKTLNNLPEKALISLNSWVDSVAPPKKFVERLSDQIHFCQRELAKITSAEIKNIFSENQGNLALNLPIGHLHTILFQSYLALLFQDKGQQIYTSLRSHHNGDLSIILNRDERQGPKADPQQIEKGLDQLKPILSYYKLRQAVIPSLNNLTIIITIPKKLILPEALKLSGSAQNSPTAAPILPISEHSARSEVSF